MSAVFAFLLALSIANPTSGDWIEAPVVLDVSQVEGITGGKDLVVLGTEALPVQADDLDNDGKIDELVFVCSIAAGVSKDYKLATTACPINPPARTHAGMYVKGFEGPGWESDRLAFRLYWDERNAVDIFCKRKPVLGLKEYSKPDVNYHQDTPWGMDVLKVGPALGAGGFGIWMDGSIHKVEKADRDFKVLVDGPIRSIIDLKYTNWEVGERRFDLIARISTIAGQRYCTVELWLTPQDKGPIPELVTGIVKHEDTRLIQDKDAGILGRWGRQALGPGEVPQSANLGLGVIVDPDQVVEFAEDENNSFFRLKGGDLGLKGYEEKDRQAHAQYKITANWEHEPNSADSTEEFEMDLRYLAAMKPVVLFEPVRGKRNDKK